MIKMRAAPAPFGGSLPCSKRKVDSSRVPEVVPVVAIESDRIQETSEEVFRLDGADADVLTRFNIDADARRHGKSRATEGKPRGDRLIRINRENCVAGQSRGHRNRGYG